MTFRQLKMIIFKYFFLYINVICKIMYLKENNYTFVFQKTSLIEMSVY